MTNITIELTSELYDRLRREAQRQGKAEQVLAQEILIGQLLTAAPVEVPLYVHLLPRIRALAATIPPDERSAPEHTTREAAIALLRSWTEAADTEADDEDTEAWEAVLRSLDAHRSSYRKLFPNLEPSA